MHIALEWNSSFELVAKKPRNTDDSSWEKDTPIRFKGVSTWDVGNAAFMYIDLLGRCDLERCGRGSESGRIHLEDSRRVKRNAQVRATVFPLGQATGADVDLGEQVKG